MSYLSRIIDENIKSNLLASGALLIKGPKFCGKTTTALQFAKSVLELDRDPQVPILMSTNPEILLRGSTPRLIDEWQEQPQLWNYIRHEVDIRKKKAQFILTGSANPSDDVRLHSGAGRFTVLQMDTMSWKEMSYSSGKIRLFDLLNGDFVDVADTALALETIVERMIIGGWPSLVGESLENAMKVNQSYVDLLCEVDMSKVEGVRRDPDKVKSLLRSLSRNIGTLVSNRTLENDVIAYDKEDLSRNTVSEYLNALSQLMILYQQPAFNTHIRSSASLRNSPKRHLCDTSLAVAALGLDKESLMRDVNYTGFLFESLVVHNLNVYAKANDAQVFHYSDSYGLEVDAVVQKRNGDYALFEIKLGVGFVEDAARNLLKFRENVDTSKMSLPKSMNIITGTGISYQRPDGVNVISIASLGN